MSCFTVYDTIEYERSYLIDFMHIKIIYHSVVIVYSKMAQPHPRYLLYCIKT